MTTGGGDVGDGAAPSAAPEDRPLAWRLEREAIPPPPRRRLLLHALPAELINAVLAHLGAEDLARVGRTCHALHAHARADLFWQPIVQAQVGAGVPLPPPPPPLPASGAEAKGRNEGDDHYKRLYLAHQPHWFLTRRRLWFGDMFWTGSLLIALYNPRRRCIEAYAVAAARARRKHGEFFYAFGDGGPVQYDTFEPVLTLDSARAQIRLEERPISGSGAGFEPVVEMDVQKNATQPILNSFAYAKALPPEVATQPSVQVWPRRKLPTPNGHRVRADSSNAFRGADHVPRSLAEASDSAFRIRQRVLGSVLARLPILALGRPRHSEVVTNYGTLDVASYTPTPEKPWQGIWCGDYNAHGVEFLLVTQPDEPRPLPAKAKRAFAAWPTIESEDLAPLVYGHALDEEDDDDNSGDEDDASMDDGAGDGFVDAMDTRIDGANPGSWTSSSNSDAAPYRGRLEAIKLTGDPNIPRGEYTFIAQDLGSEGFVGCSKEPLFNDFLTRSDDIDGAAGGTTGPAGDGDLCWASSQRSSSSLDAPGLAQGGSNVASEEDVEASISHLPHRRAEGARVVRSVGHVAGHGFTHDTYIPTQLILVSEDRLAQYWRPFRHISFYRRVDVDGLVARGWT